MHSGVTHTQIRYGTLYLRRESSLPSSAVQVPFAAMAESVVSVELWMYAECTLPAKTARTGFFHGVAAADTGDPHATPDHGRFWDCILVVQLLRRWLARTQTKLVILLVTTIRVVDETPYLSVVPATGEQIGPDTNTGHASLIDTKLAVVLHRDVFVLLTRPDLAPTLTTRMLLPGRTINNGMKLGRFTIIHTHAVEHSYSFLQLSRSYPYV